jgi:hypothetical protein
MGMFLRWWLVIRRLAPVFQRVREVFGAIIQSGRSSTMVHAIFSATVADRYADGFQFGCGCVEFRH